jgi:predicted RNA-binding protein YlxR (DUF448 family)
VVRTGAGSLALGRELPGRGAWLCRESPACVDQSTKRRAFGRALRGPVDDGEVGRLSDVLSSGRQSTGGPPEGPVL